MTTTLERIIPVHHFRERHSRLIAAPPQQVWDALTRLTVDDLLITKPLVALRHIGRRDDARTAAPVLTDGPVTLLEVTAPRYAVSGSIARPWQLTPDRHPATTLDEFAQFTEPGWVKYLTDFDIRTEGDHTRLSTETRGYSTDDHARRMFRPYWALIRLPSGLIRADMLRAIARMAESTVAHRAATRG